MNYILFQLLILLKNRISFIIQEYKVKNIELLFEYNKGDIKSFKKVEKNVKLVTAGKYKYWQYTNTKHNFSGSCISTLINCLNFIKNIQNAQEKNLILLKR